MKIKMAQNKASKILAAITVITYVTKKLKKNLYNKCLCSGTVQLKAQCMDKLLVSELFDASLCQDKEIVPECPSTTSVKYAV